MTGELNIDGDDLIYSSHCLASAKKSRIVFNKLNLPKCVGHVWILISHWRRKFMEKGQVRSIQNPFIFAMIID